MRDIFVTVVIFGALPFVLARPYIGILLWTWVSFMNPQRLCWGFAYNFPFAYIIAIVTLVSLLISREPKRIPWTRETVVLLIFILWTVITTIFSVYPMLAWPEMDKVAKIQLMVFVTMMVMQSKERLNLLVWVIALSLAFYGVKGGIFTIVHGGVYHVMGPAGTFIGGNNEMGLALIMTIPLLRYLQLTTAKAWLRYSMSASMLLCALATIGSQSRGAMLGMVVMGLFLWLKSRNKLFTGLLMVVATTMILVVMPQSWYERMATIQHYQNDASAEGRINAWKMAFNLAKDRPLGGGFNTFQPGMFAVYAPHPGNVHDSHSIYFEVLGEHGFFGLFLFLMLGLMVWRTASGIIKRARGDPENRWAADLAAMVQVSLVGYASAGAFLGLANFDLYYTLIAVVVLCKTVLAARQATHEIEVNAPAVSPAFGQLQPGIDSA
ncbi:MAG TPA: putative O-glycosylation ligase, exosortase A system-associated [Burkholderiales bacterium]|nr:putative O-glycosylation ligase, exosortase A system-associated [Burkholderiales bacterium]